MYEVIKLYRYMCSCGSCLIFFKYAIHLEGTLTFRKYVGKCDNCQKEIDIMDIHEDDILDQEYLC